MSNRRKIRNSFAVLYGRFAAEVAEEGVGGYYGEVRHDVHCPGLKHQSMLMCRCKPEISIHKLKT